MPETNDPPNVGGVPAEIMDAIFADLMEAFGVERDSLAVIRAEEVIWSDGSLGCPQPGVNYTQAQVEGYWIILEAGGVVYDYRASQSGYFIRCEGGGLGIEPPIG